MRAILLPPGDRGESWPGLISSKRSSMSSHISSIMSISDTMVLVSLRFWYITVIMSIFLAAPLSPKQPDRNSGKLTEPDLSSSSSVKSAPASFGSSPMWTSMAETSSSWSRSTNSSLVRTPDLSTSILSKEDFRTIVAFSLSSFSFMMIVVRSLCAACIAASTKMPVRMFSTPKTMTQMNIIHRAVKPQEILWTGSATMGHSEPPEMVLKSVSMVFCTLP
mmetsp:Transcript_67937/g.199536  ORF Transcript_67937/g.199536 Transcript_67937/m.199536 type:complete len:220 (-) Transcript_67937:1814-2473(-)